MFPRLFTIDAFDLLGRRIGPLTLHTYGALLAAAFLIGLWVAGRQAKRQGLDGAKLTDMAIYVLIAGLVGAKLLLLITDWAYYSKNPRELLSILQSGGVFYGGLLGALPVAWWYTRRHAIDAWRAADALVPGVAIGQAIGRLGCFAAGCCYGKPTDLPWGVTFTDVYAARTVGTPLDHALHPSQIYESLFTLLIFFGLLLVAERKRFHGQVALTYVGVYATARFFAEFLRGDVARGFLFDGALSTSQFIAILMLAGAAVALPYLLKTRRIARAEA